MAAPPRNVICKVAKVFLKKPEVGNARQVQAEYEY
jgi:hypothetical protein